MEVATGTVSTADDLQRIERYLEHVRVEKRLAARTVTLYALDLQKLLGFAQAAGCRLTA
ncbi:MAG: site-specific integrase, partial [Burkholderiales bacterium]